MQSKLSAGCPPASAHWCSSFIALMSVVNLAWLLGKSSSVLPSASSPPKATVVSEPIILSLSLSMSVASGSSMLRLMSVYGAPGPPWQVAVDVSCTQCSRFDTYS